MSTAVHRAKLTLEITPYLNHAFTGLPQQGRKMPTAYPLPVGLVSLVSTWVQFSLCRMYDKEVRLARIDYKV
jgi:hypothetical protein